jgi:hypothetical protein
MLDAGSAGGVIGAAAGAIEAGVAADLSAAAAAGNSQQLKVDLQALYDYYFKVKAVHDSFTRSLAHLPEEPYSSQELEVSPIEGVTDSVQTTVVSALCTLGGVGSLKSSASVVSAQLAKHLCQIAETYKAYVNVDDQKASELQSAGSSGAGDIGYGGGSRNATYLAQEAAALAASATLPGWL